MTHFIHDLDDLEKEILEYEDDIEDDWDDPYFDDPTYEGWV